MNHLLLIALLAGCQVPLRAGVHAPTRHGFGGAGSTIALGATATKDLETARVGGGAVFHVAVNSAPTTYQVAAQGHADIVLRDNYERQFVLATRVDASVGNELGETDADEGRTVYSFGAFIGPGIGFAPSRSAFDVTWDTLAIGFTARRLTIADESAWILGAAIELGYAVDFDRLGRSKSK